MLLFLFCSLWIAKDLCVYVVAGPDAYILYRVNIFFGPAMLGLALVRWLLLKPGGAWPGNTSALALYLAWSGLTIAWTDAEKVVGVLGIYLGLISETLAISLLAMAERRPHIALRQAMAGLLVGGAANLLFVLWMLEPTAVTRSAEGVLLHPQIFATRMVFGAIAGCFLYATWKPQRWLLGAAALLAGGIVASGSKTAILALVVLVGAFLFGVRSIPSRVRFGSGLMALLVSGWALASISSYLEAYQASGALTTLTGRVPMWEDLWRAIATRPMTGHGFGSSFAALGSPVQILHAHNEVLQQWYTVGFVGLALGILTYWQFFRFSCALPNSTRVWPVAFLLFALIRGLADPELIGLVLPAPIVVLFCAAGAHELKAIKSSRATDSRRAQSPPLRTSRSAAVAHTRPTASHWRQCSCD